MHPCCCLKRLMMDSLKDRMVVPHLIASLVFIIITQLALSGRLVHGSNNNYTQQQQIVPAVPPITASSLALSSSALSSSNTTITPLSPAPPPPISILSSSISIQNQYSNATRATLLELRASFLTKTVKFDESFRQLLSSSKRDFNNMFLSTYGLHYERNSQIFTDMYEDLERYYNNGDINLDKSMDHFFQLLYRKLFQVFNSQYDFDESYLNCISQQLEKLNPFGDYAINFISNIKRTFIATRTFLKALNVGIDIIDNMIELGQSTQCQAFIQTKLQSAPVPQISQQQQQGGIGFAIPVNRPPCLKFCEQVLEKSCFKYNQDLDKEWNNYVDSLLKLANRLRTNLNIESVVDPIDLRISEAIMNFQDNGDKIKRQVFQACGTPKSQYLGLNYPQQISSVITQSAQKTPLLRMASSSLNRRYRRDNGNFIQMKTRTNNRNRASVLPSSSVSSSISSMTTATTTTTSRPSMIPPNNNHHNTANIGTISSKNSQQQSSMLMQSSSLATTTTTTSSVTNNDEQKIINLIFEIRQQMNKTIGFWYRLPSSVCLSKQILGGYSSRQINNPPNCYSSQLSDSDNGQIGSLSRYFKTNMNPSDVKHSSTVQQQIGTLRSTIDKMNKALEGKDVDWYDTNASIITTSFPTSTTTTPPPPPSSTVTTSETTEEDDNSLPWCPTSLSDSDTPSNENTDDQTNPEDQSQANNNEHENGEEFGSGDGATGDGDSDDESTNEEDGSEEDEEESDSETTSNSQSDNHNGDNGSSTDVNSYSASSSEEQPTANSNRGWYRGKPCRIAQDSNDPSTTPSTSSSTIRPEVDIPKPGPFDVIDDLSPSTNFDGNEITMTGTYPEQRTGSFQGSSAALSCYASAILSICIPLLGTLTLNNRLNI